MSSDEIDDAAPLEAVKWSFVRRRVCALFLAHGYREVSPSALELRGTHMLARRKPQAYTVGEDLELRADPMISLAQLYARSRRGAAPAAPLTRWLFNDVVFDPTASGPHRFLAWHAVAGGLFGVPGAGAELEAILLAHRVVGDLGLHQPELRVAFGALGEDDRAGLVGALHGLDVPFVEHAGDDDAFSVEVAARPEADGEAPLVVLRGRRRDGLLHALGEPPAALLGLVVSIRRAALCTPGGAESFEAAAEVFFAASGHDARVRALAAAVRERARGLRIEVELRDLPREQQLQRAAALRARAVVEFGEDRDRVALRLVGDEGPREVPAAELSSVLRRLLR